MMGRAEFALMAERSLESYRDNPPNDGKWRCVRMTSGTTTGESLVFIRELPPTPSGWFEASGRALVCGGNMPWRLGVALFFRAEASESSQALFVDAEDIDERLAPLISDFGADTSMSFPSILARIGPSFTPEDASRVRDLILTGERFTSSTQSALAERFPQARIRPQYLIQELGYVGDPRYCAHLPLHHYHPAPGITVRLRDMDEKGIGELLVTMRFNEIIDVQDYGYGDLARLYDAPCACGATCSFEVVGRSGHDFVRLLGALVHRDEFDRVAKLCANMFDDYRATVTTVYEGGAPRGRITLTVWSAAGIAASEAHNIATRFSAELFLTPTRTLADLVRDGIFLPIGVQIAAEPFAKRHKDLRIRELDARI